MEKIVMKQKRPHGFTLIELIMAISLSSILALFSIQYVSQAALVNQMVSGQKELVDQAKVAMEFLTRELRFANLSPATAVQCGATPVDCVVATSYTSITFDKIIEDQVNPRRIDTGSTNITYAYNSAAQTLERTGEATATLAFSVTAFSVTVDDNGLYKLVLELAGSVGTNFKLVSAVRPRMTP